MREPRRRHPLQVAALLALLLLLACEAHEDSNRAQQWTRQTQMAAPNTTSAASSPQEDPVELVRVVFSSHLDVGYTNVDSEVINAWFHEHYPRAVQVAQELRRRGGPERFVFLTHSWLVALYLDCPQHIGIRCPNSTAEFEAAVRRGDIYWHALPHVAQVELFDPSLLEAAVQLSQQLNKRFGLPPPLTVNQRDVPGLTRAAIPILARQGVGALTVGVNGVSAPPAVPFNTPFWWRDERSGTQLLSFWHPGGYSGDPVDSRAKCVRAAGSRTRLCLSWTHDNSGPPPLSTVIAVFARVRQQFPGAKVVASTLDAYVRELLAQAPQLDLPVVTAEIGDTWIHGVGSDPAKVAEYRELLRWRGGALRRHGAPALARFDTLLMKIPEHTWSVDIPRYLLDSWTWLNEELHRELNNLTNSDFKFTIASWQRQRSYIDWAVQALEGTAADEARQVVEAVRAGNRAPDPSAGGFRAVDTSGPLRFAGRHWDLTLSPETGAIVGLEPQAAGGQHRGLQAGHRAGPGGAAASLHPPATSFASPDYPLAEIVYTMYSDDDFQEFYSSYHYTDSYGWFAADFMKDGMPPDLAHRNATAELQGVWRQRGEDGTLRLLTQAAFDGDLVEEGGAPQAVWTQITAPGDSRELRVDVTWQDKTPTRLPEALWVRWRPDPAAVDPSTWALHKLGQPISPLEVMLNGSRSLHAVGDGGVTVQTRGGATLRIASLDAALVSPGEPWALPRLSTQPDMEEGVAFNLVNNLWGTNYPQWVPWRPGDATMRFRFVVHLEGGEGAQPQPAVGTVGTEEQGAGVRHEQPASGAVEREQPAFAAVEKGHSVSAAVEREQPAFAAVEKGHSVSAAVEREQPAAAPEPDVVPRRTQQLGPEERQRQHSQHGAASSSAEQHAAGSIHASLASRQDAVAAAGVVHIGVWHMTTLTAISALFFAALWALGMHRQRQRRLQRDGSGGSGLGQPLRLAHSGHAGTSSRRTFSGAGCTARSSTQGAA